MSNQLREAMKTAAALAKSVPKNLQEAAFNRALDALLRAEHPPDPGPVRTSDRRKGRTHEASELGALDAIDRTRHPDIVKMRRVADQALRVLQLARDECEIDGLTASEIAQVLSKKFRVNATPSAVQMALSRETRTVNMFQGDRGKTFRVMASGDEHLAALARGEDPPARRQAKRLVSKSAKAPSAKGRSAAGRPGPKAAIARLITSGFLKVPRTIGAIREELEHRQGYSYSLQHLSPTLVRSVRDQTLTRERSDDGQYVYVAKK